MRKSRFGRRPPVVSAFTPAENREIYMTNIALLEELRDFPAVTD